MWNYVVTVPILDLFKFVLILNDYRCEDLDHLRKTSHHIQPEAVLPPSQNIPLID